MLRDILINEIPQVLRGALYPVPALHSELLTAADQRSAALDFFNREASRGRAAYQIGIILV